MQKKKYKKLISIFTLIVLLGTEFLPLSSVKAIGFWPQPSEPWHWRIQMEIKPGDILYDKDAIFSDLLGIFTIGHVGMYVGDFEDQGKVYHDQTVEARRKGVNHFDITSWDPPKRDNVYLLRVDTTQEIRGKAVEFVKQQTGKPYGFHWWRKSSDPNSPSWYCSELVWAAYYNQGIDLEHHSPQEKTLEFETPYVSPAEIFEDEDTYIISCHSTGQSFFEGIPPGCPSDNYDYYPFPVFLFGS